MRIMKSTDVAKMFEDRRMKVDRHFLPVATFECNPEFFCKEFKVIELPTYKTVEWVVRKGLGSASLKYDSRCAKAVMTQISHLPEHMKLKLFREWAAACANSGAKEVSS